MEGCHLTSQKDKNCELKRGPCVEKKKGKYYFFKKGISIGGILFLCFLIANI